MSTQTDEPPILKGAEWVRRGQLIDQGTADQRAAWARAGHEMVCNIVDKDARDDVLFFYVNAHGSPASAIYVLVEEDFRMQFEPLP